MKRRIWIFAGIAGVGAFVWLALRRTPPVEFLSDHPYRFVFVDEFTRDPAIDFSVPLIGKVIYPKKKIPIDGHIDPDVIAGFITPEAPDGGVELPKILTADGLYYDLPMYIVQGAKKSKEPLRWKEDQGGTLLGGNGEEIFTSDTVYFALPFATSNRHRDAAIAVNGRRYPIRLPLSKVHVDNSEEAVFRFNPDFSVTISEKPWSNLFEPRQWMIEGHSPPGTANLVVSQTGSFLLLPGHKLLLPLSFGNERVKVIGLKLGKLDLLASTPDRYQYRFTTPDGRFFGDNAHFGPHPNFFAVHGAGTWIRHPVQASHLPDAWTALPHNGVVSLSEKPTKIQATTLTKIGAWEFSAPNLPARVYTESDWPKTYTDWRIR